MSDDARFEEAQTRALRLQAMDQDDLHVISSLVQDSVFSSAEMTWQPGKRRFALLLNRFRWEDGKTNRAERVQSLLVLDGVLKVASSGFSRDDKDLVLSLLALEFAAEKDGAGTVNLTLAGDGGIALSVECIDVSLKDVTKPYWAISGKSPRHDLKE